MNFKGKHRLKYWLLPALVLVVLPLFSQTVVPPKKDENPEDKINKKEDVIESVIESSESESGDLENNFEEPQGSNDKKLNINKASVDDLQTLGILSDNQIISIQNYIKAFGEMKSLYELQGVYGLDRETMEDLLPYITVGDHVDNKTKSFKEQFTDGKHQVFLRYYQTIEKAAGYEEPDSSTTSYYLGDRTRMYLRYRYQYSTLLSYGITIEKDPGEKYFSPNAEWGFDYISAHFYFRDKGPFKYVALGDYEVNLGQGLICYQGFGTGKSGQVLKVKKWAKTLVPHTSTNEYNFFRGGGFTVNMGEQWEGTFFASYRGRDANAVNTDSIEEDLDEVSSLQTTGYHRTNTEIADQNAIHQLTVGGNLKWRGQKATVGVNVMYNHLDAPLNKTPELYNQFDFSGQKLFNASVDYSYLFNRFHLFGEEAISQNGGFALLNGIILKPVAGLDLSLLHRYYSRNYQTLYANAFSEGSNPVNENGFYAGLAFSPLRNVKVESYFDLYAFPWLRFLTDAPSHGSEYYTQVTWSPKRNFSMYARVKYETKPKNAPDDDVVIDYLENTKKTSFRVNLSYKIGEKFSLKTRAELSWFNDGINPTSKGYLALQDFSYSPNDDWTFTARYALFQAEDYDARIYAYENDVLYQFSVPAYYGTGSRYYVLVKYSPTRWMDIWVRFGQWLYQDQTVISSGLDEIQGNHKSEIKAQVRLKF